MHLWLTPQRLVVEHSAHAWTKPAGACFSGTVVSAQLLALTLAETSELFSGLPVAALGTPKVSMVITDAGSAPPPPPDAGAAVVVPGASGLAVGGGAGA